jgi:putative ABC transport system substrate-binding protein
MPVVGFLHSGSPGPNADRIAGFRKGLGAAGLVEGQNVAIEFRWAAGQSARLPEMAADLVGRDVSVIVTPSDTSAALAAKAATSTIPVVFAVGGDPVHIGLVASLNRPGGNLTGISILQVELTPKRFELLREVAVPATIWCIDQSGQQVDAGSSEADRASAIGAWHRGRTRPRQQRRGA